MAETKLTEFVLQITSSFVGRFFLGVVLFVVGLGAVSAISKAPVAMGRFSFGLIYVFVASIGFASPFIWAYVAADNVDTASVAYLVILFLNMTLMAYAARRRSVDAYGDTRNAFFAVIPLANLFLVFKGPVAPRTAGRTWLMLTGRIILFIPLLIVAMTPGGFIKVLAETRPSAPNLVDLPVQRAVKIQEILINSQTPYAVDAQTILNGASSRGNRLTYDYTVLRQDGQADMNPKAFELVMTSAVQTAVCGDENLSHIVRGGGQVTFSYRLNSSDEIPLTVHECNF